MAKYEVKIKIEAATTEEVKSVGCALQNAANCINHDDLVKLVNSAIKKPSLIKTALNFL